MKLILFTDDRYGFSFNHRRQSSDLRAREHLKARLAGEWPSVYMNDYTRRSLQRDGLIEELLPETHPASSRQDEASFPEQAVASSVRDDPSFLQEAAAAGGWAYVENVSLTGYYHLIDEILLYRFDKRYPADRLFAVSLLQSFTLAEQEIIPGSSHDEIEFSHYVIKKQERGNAHEA